MKKSAIKQLSIVTLSLIFIGVAWFYLQQARNEIYYLCGNFTYGVKKADVIRQLDTANLSEYKVENTSEGQRIVFSSALHSHRYKCVIDIDANNRVVKAAFTDD
jgi:hypothetical protein